MSWRLLLSASTARARSAALVWLVAVVVCGSYAIGGGVARADRGQPARSQPEASPTDGYPDGGLEMIATGGWMRFGRALALDGAPFFGGELTHHFRFGHPTFSFGMAVSTEGSVAGLSGTSETIDVIFASASFALGLRRWRRFMPFLRAGPGFLVVDGESAGLDVTGRFQFHVGMGARFFATDWLVLRADLRMFIHDNVQIGGGSGQFQDVRSVATTIGIGVIY